MPANNSSYPLSTFNTIAINSTSSTSLVLAGGATMAGNLAVTGTITGGSISYASTTTGTLAVSNGTGTTFTVASTQNSTSVGTGAFVATGGGSFGGNLYVGGSLVAGSVTYATTNTGSMNITTGTGSTLVVSSTTDSTTQSDGSATFLGGIGVLKTINTGSLKCFDATQSTSTTTGSLQTVGGFGCAGNITAGGVLNVTNATSSTSQFTGCAIFGGGIGAAGAAFVDTLSTIGKLNVGGFDLTLGAVDNATRGNSSESRALVKIAGAKLYVNYLNDFTGGTVIDSALNTIGITRIENLTPSTSTTTGALLVDGGFGIQGALNGTTAKFTSTTDSTSLTTGATIINGGLGVQFNISASSLRLYATYPSTSTTTGSLIVDGGFGLAGNFSGTTARLYDTTVSTSTTTGALRVDGGFGLAGNLSGSSARFYSTTASSSKTTGALILDGGLGLAGKISTDTGRVYNVLDATTTTAAAFVIDGGLGVAKKIISDTINTVGSVDFGGFDLRLGTTDQVTRGDTGESRALVKNIAGLLTELVVNFQSDFDRVVVQSDLKCDGNVFARNLKAIEFNAEKWHIHTVAGVGGYSAITSGNLGMNTVAYTQVFKVKLSRAAGFYTLTTLERFRLEYRSTIKYEMRFNSSVQLLPIIEAGSNIGFLVGKGLHQRSRIWITDNKITPTYPVLTQVANGSGGFNYKIFHVATAGEIADATDLQGQGFEFSGSYDAVHPDEYYMMNRTSFDIPIEFGIDLDVFELGSFSTGHL